LTASTTSSTRYSWPPGRWRPPQRGGHIQKGLKEKGDGKKREFDKFN